MGSHSYSLILPKQYVTEIGITKGDYVKVRKVDRKLIIEKTEGGINRLKKGNTYSDNRPVPYIQRSKIRHSLIPYIQSKSIKNIHISDINPLSPSISFFLC